MREARRVDGLGRCLRRRPYRPPTSFVPPLAPVRWAEPFDHREWLFELKYDGFRALAIVEPAGVLLVSRTGYVYRAFAPLCAAIRETLEVRRGVVDGELVCLRDDGRPDFRALLYRRGEPTFFAFDLLSVDGQDVREKPLEARKRALRRLVPARAAAVRYVEHVVGRGIALYRRTCGQDLEGVIAKWRRSPYRVLEGGPTWLKIKNPAYSQGRDRHELFDPRRREWPGSSDRRSDE